MMTPTLFILVALWQPTPNAPLLVPGNMVQLDAAQFTMGTPDDLMVSRYGDGWYVNQTPQSTVDVPGFSLDRHEVTTREFARFLSHSCGEYCYDARMPIDRDDGGFAAQDGAENLPVTWVDWQSAEWYCRWAGKRLPSEAEWEYAAAGAEQRRWPWGDEYGPQCHFSSYSFDGSRCRPNLRPVDDGPEGATASGILNLSGNVSEWVMDHYGPYGEMNLTSTHRVLRGGSFLTNRQQLQTKSRRGAPPNIRSVDVGFRCAWDESIEDPPGVVRGQLADHSIESSLERTEDEPTSSWETLAAGLERPGALMVVDSIAYISGSERVYIWSSDELIEIPDVTVDSWTTDGTNVLGLDGTSGALWRFEAGQAISEGEFPGIATAIAVESGWAWSDGTSIWRRGSMVKTSSSWMDAKA